jgi:hypothetical protein
MLGDAGGAHAYDRAFAIALAWTVFTATLSTLLALRLAQRGAPAEATASVPSAMTRADEQLEVARRAA